MVSTELTKVMSQRLGTTNIPGELKPFQAVDLHAEVTGFVESLNADRPICIWLMCAVVAAPPAQQPLQGVVRDSSGAVVGNASVEVRNSGGTC